MSSAQQKKATLLHELRTHTFVTLQPSAVHGIGVVALCDIPCGQKGIFSQDQSEWIPVSMQEVSELPTHVRERIENHCLFDETHYFIPEYGFNLIDPVIYLNHSEHPNVRSIDAGNDFEAIRDIKAGEELFVDYGEIVDSEE